MSSENAGQQAHIAVASNFAAAMTSLLKSFHQQSDHRITVAYGSSGKLYAQILHGAPYAAFFSADQDKPHRLFKDHFKGADEPFTYAIGQLALWLPSAQDHFDITILKSASIKRIALANPKLAPYGQAAIEALENSSLKSKLQQKFVYGENISQTYQFVLSGNAQAGIVALSQLLSAKLPSAKSYKLIDNTLYSAIKQDALLLKLGASNHAALDFLAFVKSDNALQIMATLGYLQETKNEEPLRFDNKMNN